MLYSCYNALNLPCFTVVLMLYKSRKLTCFEPEQYVLFPLRRYFSQVSVSEYTRICLLYAKILQ